jgi:hypothetical protein
MRLFGNAIQNYYGTLNITQPSGAGVPLSATSLAGMVMSLVGPVGTLAQISDGTQTMQVQTGAGAIDIGSTSASAFNLFSSNITRLSISAAGNVSISAPSSGVALAVTAASNTNVVSITAVGNGAALAVTTPASAVGNVLSVNNTAGSFLLDALASGTYQMGTVSATGLSFFTTSTTRLSISSVGGITINAPGGSETSLAISGVAAQNSVTISAAATGTPLSLTTAGLNDPTLIMNANVAGGGPLIELFDSSSLVALLGTSGTSGQIILSSAVGDFNLRTQGGSVNFSANSGASTQFQLTTSGNVNVPNGTGSISPVYAGIPQNSQTANYTFVLSDANKHIFHNTSIGQTWTIPANASVAYPIGTAITLVNPAGGSGVITLNITTDTLTFLPSGTTGSRTLATGALATILKVSATSWVISGVGVS